MLRLITLYVVVSVYGLVFCAEELREDLFYCDAILSWRISEGQAISPLFKNPR